MFTLLQLRICIEFLEITLPQFYVDILSCWNEFRIYDNVIIEPKIFKECIWFNDKIQVNKSPIFGGKKWYTCGILNISDIIGENKRIFKS